jgi:bifunctional ADP-heptose synthase (sugar kinase/adenylyltransferase)
MIVGWEGLVELRHKVAMVDGGFDPIHAGHIAYIAAAATTGLPVLCNISSDEWVTAKHPVLLPQEERALIIDALRDVDYTHKSSTATVAVLEQLRPRVYVKGKDWEGRLPAEEREACETHGVEIVFTDTVTNSSSRVMNEVIERLAAR